MSEVRELAARLWSLADSVTQEVPKRLDVSSVPSSKVICMAVMLFFVAKSWKTYKAVKELWHREFSEDALALTRTLYEVRLQAQYIAEEPVGRTQQFIDFDPVERYRQYMRLREIGASELLALLDARPEFLQELKRKHDEHATQYTRSNWWNNSIRWLAEQAGHDELVQYYSIYWFQSAQVHSGLMAMFDFAENMRGPWEGVELSKEEWATIVPFTAAQEVIGVAKAINNVASLEMEKFLSESMAEFRECTEAVGGWFSEST